MGSKGKFKSHCKHGHAMSGENLRVSKSGKRNCRACVMVARNKWAENNRERYLEMHRLRAARWRVNNPEKARLVKKNYKPSKTAKDNAIKRTIVWRQENVEKFLAQRRDHYERNKERLLTYWRELHKKNRGVTNAQRRERYNRDNPGAQIRKLARDVGAGRIDSDAAIARIREILTRIDGRNESKA